MAELAVGVIGVGGIATREHIPSFASHPDTELVAVCDPDEAQREAVAEDWDITGRYQSHDAMLADTDLDVVDICSPPHRRG